MAGATAGTHTIHQHEVLVCHDLIVSGFTTATATIVTTASHLVGFYGATPTSQPTSAAQAALTCTALSVSGVVGFTSTAQFSNFVGLLNAVRQALVDNGLMKGS